MMSNKEIAEFVSVLRGDRPATTLEMALKVLAMRVSLWSNFALRLHSGEFRLCKKGHPGFGVDSWPMCDDDCIPY